MNPVVAMNLIAINTISGYEHFNDYFVSDTGEVWSSKRYGKLTKLKHGMVRINKAVWLYDKRKRRRCIFIANLVARAFLPNLTNSQRVKFKTEDRMDCSVNNVTWEREKKIRERTGIEKDIIMLDDDVVKKFKQLYEAVKLKGYSVPTSTEFMSDFLETAMEDYINRYGLRKILYQMNNK
jgi:hypothetical protein